MRVAERRIQPPVALAAATLAALAFLSYPLGGEAFISAFFAAVLVVIAAIDIRSLRIPNRIVLPATAVVLVADAVLEPSTAIERLLAALLVGAVLLLPNLISSSWIGMGDVKLGMLLGVALGWGAVGALEIAFLALLPVAVVVLVRGGREARNAALPFGPFMAFGALVVLIVPRLPGLGG
jgi:prepilin signal peptidase PulO-like enzyme (type II secretory pathway)